MLPTPRRQPPLGKAAEACLRGWGARRRGPATRRPSFRDFRGEARTQKRLPALARRVHGLRRRPLLGFCAGTDRVAVPTAPAGGAASGRRAGTRPPDPLQGRATHGGVRWRPGRPQRPSRGGEQTCCAPEVTGSPPAPRPPSGGFVHTRGWTKGASHSTRSPSPSTARPGTATLTSTGSRPRPRPPGPHRRPRTGRWSSWPASWALVPVLLRVGRSEAGGVRRSPSATG